MYKHYCVISTCDTVAVWLVTDNDGGGEFNLCGTCHEAFDLANSGTGWNEEYIYGGENE